MVWTQNLGREHRRTPCHPTEARVVRVIDIVRDETMRGGWCATVDHGVSDSAPVPRSYASSYLRAGPPPTVWTYEPKQVIEALVNGVWIEARILAHESWDPEEYVVTWGVRGCGTRGLDALRPVSVEKKADDDDDAVDHPAHYGGKDDPYEAIKVIEAWKLGFCLGNTVKYISRCERKGAPIEDLEKARWYLDREIARRKAAT